MHIISKSTLNAFVARHTAAAIPVRAWVTLMERAHFRTPHEIKAVFPATDFLGNSVAVFDLGGNNFRISANVRYVNDVSRVGRVYIRRVMTHAEYSRRSQDGTL